MINSVTNVTNMASTDGDIVETALFHHKHYILQFIIRINDIIQKFNYVHIRLDLLFYCLSYFSFRVA